MGSLYLNIVYPMRKFITKSIFNIFVLTHYDEYIPKEIIELITMSIYPRILIIVGNYYTRLMMDDVLYKWGESDEFDNFIPNDITRISRGVTHIAFMTKNDEVYICGNNNYGELGLGHRQPQTSPQKLSLSNIVMIFCGVNHTIALVKSGKVYTWGSNSWGNLGLGHNADEILPQQVN